MVGHRFQSNDSQIAGYELSRLVENGGEVEDSCQILQETPGNFIPSIYILEGASMKLT